MRTTPLVSQLDDTTGDICIVTTIVPRVRIHSHVIPGFSDDLPEDAAKRVHTLIRDYLEATVAKKYSHSQDEKNIHIELRNRSYCSQEDITPDTPALLEQALEIGQTVEKIIGAEHTYCKREQESILTQRKSELGLVAEVTKPE